MNKLTLALGLCAAAMGRAPGSGPGTPGPNGPNEDSLSYESKADYVNDNRVLNYALTLEHLEAAFYRNGLKNYGSQLDPVVRHFLEIISAHEEAHVAALTMLLEERGAKPVKKCSYTFPDTDVASFLSLAHVLEETGVQAYDGAISSLTQPDLVTLAGSVATVEARHAAYLDLVQQLQPWGPTAFDTPLTKDQVLTNAAGFFNGQCDSLSRVEANELQTGDRPNYSQGSRYYKNDNRVLQYALTLEHLEANFYANGLAAISQASFTAAGLTATEYGLLQMAAAHEASHVARLTSVLTARGATPVGECQVYRFTYEDSAEGALRFIRTAIHLEETGTSAYLGAAADIADTDLLAAAATITTVEARHASFLREVYGRVSGKLNKYNPFPNVTDEPLSPEEVIDEVTPYASGCPSFKLPRTLEELQRDNSGHHHGPRRM